MHLSKFVHTPTGKVLMSILLGFGLAALFRKTCKGKNCFVYHAPPLENVKDKTFKYDNKCYVFTTNNIACDNSKQVVEFE